MTSHERFLLIPGAAGHRHVAPAIFIVHEASTKAVLAAAKIHLIVERHLGLALRVSRIVWQTGLQGKVVVEVEKHIEILGSIARRRFVALSVVATLSIVARQPEICDRLDDLFATVGIFI